MKLAYMTRILVLATLLFQPLTSAQIPEWNVDLSIYGFGADSTQVNALKGGMRIGVDANGEITEELGYRGKMNIFFEEGSHTALNNDSYSTATTYGIDEALLLWSPLSFLKLQVGVDALENPYAPLFITVPSLGLGQNLKLADYDFFELSLFSRQNVVSVNSTQSRTGSVSNRAAYYLNGGFHSKLIFSRASLHLHYNYFSYEKLSSALADKSRFRGNTVVGTGDSAQYLFDYKGHDISMALELDMLFHKMILFGEYLQNPDSKDSGVLIGLRAQLTESHEVSLENFENEPDTLPAISVSPYYGGTNRKGQKFGYRYQKDNNEIKLNYYKMETVETAIYQDDLDIFMLEYKLDV